MADTKELRQLRGDFVAVKEYVRRLEQQLATARGVQERLTVELAEIGGTRSEPAGTPSKPAAKVQKKRRR